jgi:hypothetical protein
MVHRGKHGTVKIKKRKNQQYAFKVKSHRRYETQDKERRVSICDYTPIEKREERRAIHAALCRVVGHPFGRDQRLLIARQCMPYKSHTSQLDSTSQVLAHIDGLKLSTYACGIST